MRSLATRRWPVFKGQHTGDLVVGAFTVMCRVSVTGPSEAIQFAEVGNASVGRKSRTSLVAALVVAVDGQAGHEGAVWRRQQVLPGRMPWLWEKFWKSRRSTCDAGLRASSPYRRSRIGTVREGREGRLKRCAAESSGTSPGSPRRKAHLVGLAAVDLLRRARREAIDDGRRRDRRRIT